MFRRIQWLCIILSLLFSPFVLSQQDNSIVHGPFSISWCDDGRFYFEETPDLDYPIHFILECGNDKKIVDKYYADGANIIVLPNNKEKVDLQIESVFFQKVKSKKHLFVIIKRISTHTGLDINGNDYNVYAYEYHPKNIIQLDQEIMKDEHLWGSEGESNGEISHFKYKTAAEVKKYINETYNNKR